MAGAGRVALVQAEAHLSTKALDAQVPQLTRIQEHGEPARTEKRKMLAGEPYDPEAPELVADRARCRSLLRAFDGETHEASRLTLLRRIFGAVGLAVSVFGPLVCDYGYNIEIGSGVLINFYVVILDAGLVRIGSNAKLGPGAQIITADHPREPKARRTGVQTAAPVTIGRNAWIGAGALVLPGVTVGKDSIVGAGSVVTKDVPPGVVAVGNPCRVMRSL